MPTNPQIVYVPTYNPTVVYGAWPYSAYPPYAYYPPGYTAAAAAFTFAAGVAVGSALRGDTNWHGNNVNVNTYNSYNKIVNTVAKPTTLPAQGTNAQSWQHNAEHRKGVEYRDTASQQRYGKTTQPDAQSREAFRGRADQGRQDLAKSGGGQVRQGGEVSGQRPGAPAFQGAGGGGGQTRDFSSRGQTSRASSPAAAGQAGGGSRTRGGGRTGGGGRK